MGFLCWYVYIRLPSSHDGVRMSTVDTQTVLNVLRENYPDECPAIGLFARMQRQDKANQLTNEEEGEVVSVLQD